MASLESAHRGYEYQDLMVACRLLDVLIGSITKVHVDKKLVPDDRFDDLTTIDKAGLRDRIQLKHTDTPAEPLPLTTFTTESRRLRLDRIFCAALEDRAAPGAAAHDHCFRVILMDVPPTHPRLIEILEPASRDPGPFARGMQTTRMKFRSDALWPHYDGTTIERSVRDHPFAFLGSALPSVNRPDLDWVCEHLVVEFNSPIASLDLSKPGPAEQILLQRVRDEIGAGAYPNQDRTPLDVAAALIDSARAARRGSVTAERATLLQRTGLRTDFGAVTRRHPVNTALEVTRSEAVSHLVTKASDAASQKKPLLLSGPPGHGKSWICKQVVDSLEDQGWLVAEHYCYIGDADAERRPRVLVESLLGSLLRRLAEQAPDLVAEQRPLFAASHGALEQAVCQARDRDPERRVALVVDGLDHVTRIIGGSSAHDPSLELVRELALLNLPTGSTLVLLSQPGLHLQPLEDTGAICVSLPGLTDEELHTLALRLGVIDELQHNRDVEEFIQTLAHQSAGNALYATYLCREALRRPAALADPSAAIRTLPPFDGTLLRYYEHIRESLGAEAAWVSDILGLIDFSLTRSELKAIRPDGSHYVDDAVERLGPVLSEHAAQSGIRIYHESYARFLQEPYRENPTAKSALLDRIIEWLANQGIFNDGRAYRHLLRTQSLAGKDVDVVETVDRNFVVESIAHGFPASAIIENLSVAIASAARIDEWPAIVRYVEMSRSAETYQEERFESAVVSHADVVGRLLGPRTVADRLLDDGRPTMAARQGIQMCAEVDAMGAVAPWSEYMDEFFREDEDVNTIYDDASDKSVNLAWMRGRLRLASRQQDQRAADATSAAKGDPADSHLGLHARIDWDALAKWIAESDLGGRSIVDAVLDTFGPDGVVELTSRLVESGACSLAVAEAIRANEALHVLGDPTDWASNAARLGVSSGNAYRFFALGCDVTDVRPRLTPADAGRTLRDLADAVQDTLKWRETDRVAAWIDACTVAARLDGFYFPVVSTLIEGPGWYGCWLRFVVSLSIAEAKPVEARSTASLQAIQILDEVDNPFLGDPRACDLYPIHGLIRQTIGRAVNLLSDNHWRDAIRVLDRVSNAMSTTIRGEQGGPLPRSAFLDLVVGTANTVRHDVAEAFIEYEIENGGAGTFYEDLAGFRLAAARLALQAGDQAKARRRWTQACELLTAYGWRKDITVQEVLHPLPTMILIAPDRGRAALAKIQGLCERIPQHTDGKSTWHTPREWRRLLAAADPCALAEIITKPLFESCNDPNSHLHEARSDLWRAGHQRADPLVSAALRVTLAEPLDDHDATAFARLANATQRGESERILVAWLARLDERPFRYSDSNSPELLDKDRKHVRGVNAVADAAGLPTITALPPRPMPSTENVTSSARSTPALGSPEIVVAAFPPGMLGIALAARAWRDKPYDNLGTTWTTDRFANLLGYRIVELAESGSYGDAEAALRLLADAMQFGDRDGLLKNIAEGLERHTLRVLAAIAYTLAWTRTRGRGGWMTFAGNAEIDSLRHATRIDPALAKATLAEEVERVVAHGLGSIGVTQALTLAFARGCLNSARADCFAVWDEAAAVISARAPRVSALDDPDDVYVAPDPDHGEALPGSIDAAFAAAALSGITHPGREHKRRSFLAAWILITERAAVVAPAIALALRSTTDPATLTWLLRLIAVGGDRASGIVSSSRGVLLQLANSPWLTVRVLARSLLPDDEIPLGTPSAPDPELLDHSSGGIIRPVTAESGKHPGSANIVSLQAGVRLARAESMLPGITDAVVRRFHEARPSESLGERMRLQLRALTTRPKEHWPDAFVAWAETIEDAIQRVSSGARLARLMSGDLASDPKELERQLAHVLLDDPEIPLDLEGARVPRPDIPSPPSRADSLWSVLSASETKGHVGDRGSNHDHHTPHLRGTLEVTGPETVPVLTNGSLRGWHLVATVEQRTIPEDRYEAKPEHASATRYRSVELRTDGDQRALSSPPFAEGDAAFWYSMSQPDTADHHAIGTCPIVGLDSAATFATDGHYGLGLPTNLLTPTRRLMSLLDLKPGPRFSFDDPQGPAMYLLTWRTEYETSDYHLPRPLLIGAGLALRADVFAHLVDATHGLLTLRDFLEGSAGLRFQT